MILPHTGPSLRQLTTYRNSSKSPSKKKSTISYEAEWALARLLYKQVSFIQKLEVLKVDLSRYGDFIIADLFNLIDASSCGKLDIDAVYIFMKRNKLSVTENDIVMIIRVMDHDNDGKLSYTEFCRALLPFNSTTSTSSTKRSKSVAKGNKTKSLKRTLTPVDTRLKSEQRRTSKFGSIPNSANSVPKELPSSGSALRNVREVMDYSPAFHDDILTGHKRRTSETSGLNDRDDRNSEASHTGNFGRHRLSVDASRTEVLDNPVSATFSVPSGTPLLNMYQAHLQDQQADQNHPNFSASFRSPIKPNANESLKSIRSGSAQQNHRKGLSAILEANPVINITSAWNQSINEKKKSLPASEAEGVQNIKRWDLDNVTDREGSSDLEVAKELAISLKEQMDLDREVEHAKNELALQIDFNIVDIFRLFNMKGKGSITQDELRNGFELMKISLSYEEIKTLMARFDTDHDGILRYSRFIVYNYVTILDIRTSLAC